MRISDWSSDVCSSDLDAGPALLLRLAFRARPDAPRDPHLSRALRAVRGAGEAACDAGPAGLRRRYRPRGAAPVHLDAAAVPDPAPRPPRRSAERRVGTEWAQTCLIRGSA